MELAVGLQFEGHLSLKAFCDAIIQSQIGFPVMVRPDEVISKKRWSYRTRLTGDMHYDHDYFFSSAFSFILLHFKWQREDEFDYKQTKNWILHVYL